MTEIGKRLREERERLGIPLDEIVQYTKIPKRYLEALESDLYRELPSLAHAKAYLGKYLDLLGLPNKKQLIDLYKTQHYEQEKLTPQSSISVFRRISSNTLVITTQQAVIFIAALITFLLLFYIYAQVRSLLAAPMLTLLAPTEGETIQTSSVVVEGKTDPDALLFINNQKVDVAKDGSFKEKVELLKAYNQNVVVTATNKISKAKTELARAIKTANASQEVSLLDKSTAASASDAANEANTISLKIRVTQDTGFTITQDGEKKNIIMVKQKPQVFKATSRITLYSGKPHSTYISCNNEPEERMGTASGALTVTYVFDNGCEKLE